ncbi:hypothetical protein IEU95_10305 [Hoyosella rhizosphaerae]|uniref:Uncharacterized protein n=1 Tax=Hoyosella rhizosphaerae TaxID=1755582 RepID=A0A916U0A7_9ACTN|nr:hypothetical protein [Hoyosella rhizosphaerae]MBN4927225.1 hypothetical protein [Hoyosella rhizosphaerae]GGC52983.1 hypothetical protein GCM10011410_01630 [Hoyosella rhizosphaerae]
MNERSTNQAGTGSNDVSNVGGKKNVAYLLIAVAVVAIPGALMAAAGSMTGVAIALGVAAAVFLIVGIVLWRQAAVVLSEELPDTNDRQNSSEGRGPLSE